MAGTGGLQHEGQNSSRLDADAPDRARRASPDTSSTKAPGIDARGKATRQRIVVAVWDVLTEHGYAKLTVRSVARKAGVSHAMIHYYFSSKDDLVLAVVEYARSYWIHPLEDRVYGAGTPAEKLENIVTWMAEPATRDVMRVHRQLLAQSEWSEELRTAMATEYTRWRSSFVELFRQMEVEDLFTPGTDVALLGAGFSTLSDSLVSKRALDPNVDSQAIMEEILRPFLKTPLGQTVAAVSPSHSAVQRDTEA